MSSLSAAAAPRTSTLSIRSMLHRVIATEAESAAFLARVVLGFVILPHGAQKLLGAFGGYGFTGTMSFFTETMGIPAPLALLAILAESIGALALVFGLFGRVGAFGIATVMAVAALMSHLPHGFFMNWFGNQAGEGFEFHLLAIGLAAIVMLRGSGRWSVDRLLLRAPSRG